MNTIPLATTNAAGAGLRAYTAIFGARFRTLLQYRAAALAGFGTQLFWGLIRVMIFMAFYENALAKPPIPLGETITYLWLTQAFLAIGLWFGDSELTTMIRTGNVAYEMLRPLDLYTFWYCRALAGRFVPVMLRAIPMVTLASLVLGMKPPPSFATTGVFLLAIAGAMLVAAALSVLVTTSLLYTIAGDGIQRMTPFLNYVFSGMLMPLPLMPDWMQPLLRFLPFRALADTPFQIYIGRIAPQDALPPLLHQWLWTAVLILIGRSLLLKASRRLVVQGG